MKQPICRSVRPNTPGADLGGNLIHQTRRGSAWVLKNVVLVVALSAVAPALIAYTPAAGTPLANRVHPRLHLTPDNIPALRDAIGTHYQSEFQAYVNWAANEPQRDKDNTIGGVEHDILLAQMIDHSFIGALGPVAGINYPISLDDHMRLAIDRLLSQLQAGSPLGFAAALTYDWAYNSMSSGERSQAANLMLNRELSHHVFDVSLANPEMSTEDLFSSRYYEGMYPFYMGLALWGDGLIDSAADRAVDTFYGLMLNHGYLDGQNFVAGSTGGWTEWIGYSSWHLRTHFLFVDAWRTATGEDYLSTLQGSISGNAIRHFPAFLQYAIDPHKYYGSFYTFVGMGDRQTTDTSIGTHRSMREQLLVLPRLLAESGLSTEASLMRHFNDRWEVPWPNYERYALWGFLGVARNVPPITPESLNLPKSLWSKNMGGFFARTGFSSSSDSVFTVTDGHFRYIGHAGPPDFPGFSLTKFGELANTQSVSHRGYGNLSDYVGASKQNVVTFDGNHQLSSLKHIESSSDLLAAANGQGNYDHGGIEQVTRRNDRFYHVRGDRSRVFNSGVSHTREYVWMPGENPASDSDYLIIYDRTFAPSDAKWVYHVPWQPSVTGHSSTQDLRSGSGLTGRIGTAYEGTDMVLKELNGLGGESDNGATTAGLHGVLFCKTLVPLQTRVEVTRVAQLDSDVINRQGNLAMKAHRWQVGVRSQTTSSTHQFLHVFQTADANLTSSMTDSNVIDAGSTMDGAWIERENGNRPNHVVLFAREAGVNNNPFSYSITGQGVVRHVLTGLKPHTSYQVVSGSTTNTYATESDVETWDYKGVATNTETGVLYFESTISGTQTFTVSTDGSAAPPSTPTGLVVLP